MSPNQSFRKSNFLNMTKVKYSALVSEMRNKLNGSVMSKNRYGNYIRNKVTPVNPQTSFQLEQRSNLASLSAGWRALLQAERDAWINAAKDQPRTDIFGDSKILTGQALYVSANLNLLASGSAAISSPAPVVDVPLFSITGLGCQVAGSTPDEFQFIIAPTTVPAGFKLIVYATSALSAGIEFAKNRFRYLGTFVPSGGTIDFTSAWAARFGAANEGTKIFVRVALVSTTSGQLGLPYQAQTIVIAV